MCRLFIVDDDVLTCDLLATITESLFTEIITYQSGRDFIEQPLLASDIIILDLMMPEFDGVEVIRHISQAKYTGKLVLISGYDRSVLHSAECLAQDYGLEVIGSFTKPIANTQLIELLSQHSIAQNKQPVSTDESKLKGSLVAPNPKKLKLDSSDIKNGIFLHQFVMYYQPQISLKTQQLIGVEALVRWQHPSLGLLSPYKFISLAERFGLINQLTEEILQIVISQAAQWKSQGRDIKISVNLSAHNINSLLLPEQLTALVQANNIDTSMIVLEVTETALMENLTTALDILTRLRLKGFQLSIDDFGTGFSSLSQLHKIPFTELKIDQSFIMNMQTDLDCLAIVETCIMLGHKLEMDVVAEGVENKAILDLLNTLGCDVVQGYYYAKPMPAEELSVWQKNLFNHTAKK